jgi:AAA15 family ATPase/GTPase
MILKEFDYSEFDGLSTAWSLKNMTLSRINLLVGKNATGKTNALTKINWLTNILAGLQPQLLNSGNYDVKFSDDLDEYHYVLNLSKSKVVYEELTINGEQKFFRKDDGIGDIDSEQFQSKMKFQLMPNQLVVVSKRDAIQHPFLQKLFNWAEGARFYEFSTPMGRNTFLLTNNTNNIIFNPKDYGAVVAVFLKGEQEFSHEFKKSVLNSMNDIGYTLKFVSVKSVPEVLSSIPLGVMPPVPVNSNALMLYVSENADNINITQQQMSQGMFRALSLIILMTYNIFKKLSSTILIDDIGEGLDFDRSTKLIKLLIDLAEKNDNIQLIMSTNDRFVMNAVPLEYWQVIQRKGGECRVFNYQNSKEKFDEFEYTGLNNFDFLRTDFINSNWESV